MLGEIGPALFEILARIVMEGLIRGPGYLIQRPFYRADEIHFGGAETFFLGLGFWLTLAALFWGLSGQPW